MRTITLLLGACAVVALPLGTAAAGPVRHDWKGGELPLENGHIGNQGRRHVRSSVALAGRHSKTNGSLSVFVGRHGAMKPARRYAAS
jgi:hypothetical protein